MTRRALYAATAWTVVLTLTLAACGSQTSPDGTPADAANITFKTDPSASVWIDGENKGTTPIVIAVAAGKHEVVLKAPGFQDEKGTIDVEAGKDLTVETGLTIGGSSVEDYKRLLAALSVEHEEFGEVKVHRGAGDAPVMLYWPQRDVRKTGLSTYRIEVTPDYENDGWIEFRKGSKVLYREKFDAESLITERALPTKVIEALKTGGTYTWGIYFESKRKKPITVKFTVINSRKIDRKLARLARRKTYQRANALMREMARIDVLRNYRLYSETLSQSLRVLNTWPDTQMPFKTIHFALERLKLKESQLYQEVASNLLGKGVSARRPDLSGVNRNEAKGGQGTGLPPSLVAPRVPADKATGMKPGGMGVTPTPDAQKREPGPIVPESEEGGSTPSDDGVRVDPRADGTLPGDRPGGDPEKLADLERKLADAIASESALKEAFENNEAAREAAEAAKAAIGPAQEAANGAAKALQDAIDAGKPQSEIDALEQAAKDADKALADALQASRDADQHATNADQAHEEAKKVRDKVLEESGTIEKLKEQVESLRKEIDEGPKPGRDLPTADDPRLPGDPRANEDDGTGKVEPAVTPQKLLDDARSHQHDTAQCVEDLSTRKQEAEDALAQADKDLQAAEKELGDLEASGTATQDQIDAAQAKVEAAAEEMARAQIQSEQAAGELQIAEQTLAEANEELQKAEKKAMESDGK